MFIHDLLAVILTALFSESTSKVTTHVYRERRWYTATLTPYEVIGDLDAKPISYPGYEPVALWFVGRHGTRYPEKKTIYGMFKELPGVRDRLRDSGNQCNSEELDDWVPATNLGPGEEKSANLAAQDVSINIDELKTKADSPTRKLTKSITLQGKTTMETLGQRFRTRFGALIPDKLDPSIEIKYTKTVRNKESAFSFVTGLFGKPPPEDSPSLIEADYPDVALKFAHYCLHWKYAVKARPEWLEEYASFTEGTQVTNVLNNVRKRCALPDLDFELLKHIYMTCSYELAWYDKSPWCNFLEDEEKEVLEFVQDLKYFNHSAYGHPFNYKIACPMLKQMFEFLTTNPEVPVRFNFSHISTMVKFSAHLGLFPEAKDEPLTGSNYKRKVDRKWNSSSFAGFSFNFTFVLFKSNNDGRRYILLLLNEKVVRIPKCASEGDLCPEKKFEEIFYDSIHHCHFEEWCQNEKYQHLEDEAPQKADTIK